MGGRCRGSRINLAFTWGLAGRLLYEVTRIQAFAEQRSLRNRAFTWGMAIPMCCFAGRLAYEILRIQGFAEQRSLRNRAFTSGNGYSDVLFRWSPSIRSNPDTGIC